MKPYYIAIAALALMITGCDFEPSSDQRQQAQQERILQEGTSTIGMPNIQKFREKRILKDILELRDQEGLNTFTYIVAENSGKLIFLGNTIGYGIPAATQFTNPQKVVYVRAGEIAVLPQADPNGLFSPTSAEGTWVLMKDPNGDQVKPLYVEPRIVVSPFKLNTSNE